MRRIVSLVPSQTELLHYLGLGERVVGITRFCIHPENWFKTKRRVGGTKDFKVGLIRELAPDIILANKEENTKEGIRQLGETHRVWVSDVSTYQGALDMIAELGVLLDVEPPARRLIDTLTRLQAESPPIHSPIPCTYLIWRKPYMTVGGDTLISDMMGLAGLENVHAQQLRYPTLTTEDLRRDGSERILLSTEPYPFKMSHVRHLEQATGKSVHLVDGELFSWYGSRLLHSWEYFRRLRAEMDGDAR